jgi:hypothetical protein
VVGVKMGDQYCLDGVAVDRKLVHRNERGRATIDERVEIATDQMETGVKSSARAERVAATDELQVHEEPSIQATPPAPLPDMNTIPQENSPR